ncbi:hypothetical protein [Glycomyces xiaoerkulensis]|uniref:hypothetical protein n=1 Tax=Glycomyces xiaoerkulensis TaxID=2038139 RepID=UPI000C25E812|nr:hypothetical protein [Glycomyces xiaoerkulensis]
MTRTAIPIDHFRTSRLTAIESGLESALERLALEFPPASTVGHRSRAMLPESLLKRVTDADPTGAYPTDTGELLLAEAALGDADPSWRLGVAWIRIGAVERLNRRATDRLTRRRVGKSATITLPLVRATVGDIAAWLGEALALLEAAADDGEPPAALVERDIDRALRATWKLFGASGYIVDAPSNLAQALSILGEVYSIETGGEL